MSATCSGCGKPITWGTTSDGKKIPLDRKAPVYEIVGENNHATFVDRAPVTFAVSHFATCSHANNFSSSRKPKS